MNEIRIASRAYSLNEASPGRILHKVNGFSRCTRPTDLVTALIVLLDPVTGEAKLSSAGHLPPIIAHRGRAEFVPMRLTATARLSPTASWCW